MTIPEDVMKAAGRCFMDIAERAPCEDEDGEACWSGAVGVDDIARAILAERERCAKIADALRAAPRYTEWAYLTGCADVARAIRSPRPTDGAEG